MTNDFSLILSLISLGFFGGFTHCVGMCGPFVLTQVGNILQKTPLTQFSEFRKLKNLSLLPYNLGRITTYSVLGFFCSLFTNNIQKNFGFKIISALFLFLAALIFINLFLDKKLHIFRKIQLRFKSRFLESATSFFSKKISNLFQNPLGFKGYLLGIILGFIPCGLLYAAFLISASIENPILAATGMFCFGISTFPSLFLTACGSGVIARIPEFKLIAKTLILFNAITLLLMAVRLIF